MFMNQKCRIKTNFIISTVCYKPISVCATVLEIETKSETYT